MIMPKHRFISWLGVQHRLQTQDKLYTYGISTNSSCCICCNAIESHSHLIFMSATSVSKCCCIFWTGLEFKEEKSTTLVDVDSHNLQRFQSQKGCSSSSHSCRSLSYLDQ